MASRALGTRAGAACLGALVAIGVSGRAWAAGPGYAAEVMSDGPVAYYRFSEPPAATSALDFTGNGHHGAYSPVGVTLGQQIAVGDQAAAFSDGRAVVDDQPELNPGAVTVEAVVVSNGPSGLLQRIVDKATTPLARQSVYMLGIDDAGFAHAEVWTGDTHVVTGTTPIEAGRVFHLAMTYDGTDLTLFVNGVEESSLGVAAPMEQATTRPLGLGNQAERDRPFDGVLDEAAIFDAALSPARILAHASEIPELVEPPTDAGADGSNRRRRGRGGHRGGRTGGHRRWRIRSGGAWVGQASPVPRVFRGARPVEAERDSASPKRSPSTSTPSAAAPAEWDPRPVGPRRLVSRSGSSP